MIVAILVLMLCFVLEKVAILIVDDYFLVEPKEHVDVVESNMQNKEEKIKQDALTYLEERYDEEFVVFYERGTSSAYNYIQLYAYPVAQQDEMHEIKIQGYYDDSRNINFYDDYVMVRLTEEYEECINPIIDEYFDEYKFYVDFYGEWLMNNLPPDTKSEDLWNMQANVDYPLPRIVIFLGPETKDLVDNSDRLLKHLSLKNVRSGVSIIYIEEEEKFSSLKGSQDDDLGRIDYDDYFFYLIYDEKNFECTSGINTKWY